MRSFNYSFLENQMFPAKLVSCLYSVAELHGRINLRKDSMSDVLARMEQRAIAYSSSEDERHSALYREARAKINKNYSRIDVSVDNIFELHSVLSPNPHSPSSGYRHNQYAINMPGEIKKSVQFQTIPPKEIPEAMHQLVNAYNEAAINADINPLLLIPCFVFDFLCIRPFELKSEQMSQLLFLLLFCKGGFEVVRCIPFEEQIRLTKAEYDIAFKDSTANWHEGKNKYFPFMEYCLDILLFCYKEIDKRRGRSVTNAVKITKEERVRYVVLSSISPISKAEIHAELSNDVAMGTIEKVLGDMVREGVAEKRGGGRSTRYVKRMK